MKRDKAQDKTQAQARDVEKVLGDLGIDILPADSHILEVWNKLDLLSADRRAELQHEASRAERPPVLVSAASGHGLEGLLAAIDARLGSGDEILDVVIPAAQGRLLNWLHETAEVMSRTDGESGEISVRIRMPAEKKDRIVGQIRKAGIAV